MTNNQPASFHVENSRNVEMSESILFDSWGCARSHRMKMRAYCCILFDTFPLDGKGKDAGQPTSPPLANSSNYLVPKMGTRYPRSCELSQ
jgi:hypothetical protein